MGKRVQIARKSTGGKAPRKQLATRARDAVIESHNDESPRNDLDDPFFELVEERGRTPHTARKSTWGRAPRKQLATRARAAVIESDDGPTESEEEEADSGIVQTGRTKQTARMSIGRRMPRKFLATRVLRPRGVLPPESENDGSSESGEEEADSGIVQTARTNQTARKSTGGAMPRRQLATKARRAVIPSNLDQSFDSDFDNEPPVKQQKLEAKLPPKMMPFNFTKGTIIVINENTDKETLQKYHGTKNMKNRFHDFVKQKWCKFEGGYIIARSTGQFPVIKIKLEYLMKIGLSDKRLRLINQLIEADKESVAQEPAAIESAALEKAALEPATIEPAPEEPNQGELDQDEFEVLEFLGPEINVPEEKVDNNKDSSIIEPKATPESTKETNTSSEEKKSDHPDVIIID